MNAYNRPHGNAHTPQLIVEREASERYLTEYTRLSTLASRTSLPIVASHTSALKILGVELPQRYEGRFNAGAMHIAVGEKNQRHLLTGTSVHACDPSLLSEHSLAISPTFAVVSPELALLQMATVIPLLEVIILGDCMMRRGVQQRTTKDRLRAFLQTHQGLAGRKRLLRALPLMRENTDSSYESRQRIALACRGLGSAAVNAEIASDRETPWSVDLAYPELMTVIEYDGRFHMTDATQGERDKEKRGWLRARGWEILESTNARIATAENRDLFALDVAKAFSKALDMPIRPLPCVPVEYLTDRRHVYRASGLELPQLSHYFSNPA